MTYYRYAGQRTCHIATPTFEEKRNNEFSGQGYCERPEQHSTLDDKGQTMVIFQRQTFKPDYCKFEALVQYSIKSVGPKKSVTTRSELWGMRTG